MYLCEVAIVSQLCTFPLMLLHGSCEDYLTCDIAFNAVMPLSRASTRGRYSRIEGVTLEDLSYCRGTYQTWIESWQTYHARIGSGARKGFETHPNLVVSLYGGNGGDDYR